MGMPQAGQIFPDFELGDFSLRRTRGEGPLVIVLWKTECPTCRLAMPFFERMHRAYPKARIVSVIQNQPDEAAQYMGANHLTLTTLPDTALRATRMLEVDYVPTYWLLDEQGTILASDTGWDREKFEGLAQVLAQRTGASYSPLVTDADQVPAFKPG